MVAWFARGGGAVRRGIAVAVGAGSVRHAGDGVHDGRAGRAAHAVRKAMAVGFARGGRAVRCKRAVASGAGSVHHAVDAVHDGRAGRAAHAVHEGMVA